jgi:hypothetical protein
VRQYDAMWGRLKHDRVKLLLIWMFFPASLKGIVSENAYSIFTFNLKKPWRYCLYGEFMYVGLLME